MKTGVQTGEQFFRPARQESAGTLPDFNDNTAQFRAWNCAVLPKPF